MVSTLEKNKVLLLISKSKSNFLIFLSYSIETNFPINIRFNFSYPPINNISTTNISTNISSMTNSIAGGARINNLKYKIITTKKENNLYEGDIKFSGRQHLEYINKIIETHLPF